MRIDFFKTTHYSHISTKPRRPQVPKQLKQDQNEYDLYRKAITSFFATLILGICLGMLYAIVLGALFGVF